jgi:hypothetical protein
MTSPTGKKPCVNCTCATTGFCPRGVGANIPPELAAQQPAAKATPLTPGPATPGATPPASRQASRDAFLSPGHGERPPVRESPPFAILPSRTLP